MDGTGTKIACGPAKFEAKSDLEATQRFQQLHQQVGDAAGNGNGEDPGPSHAFHHRPFDWLRRLAAPTPMIEAEILCVVETGIPLQVAAKITRAELVSAAKPLIGCSLTMRWPRVRMIRQPPAAVPAAMVMAQSTLIQVAISSFWPGAGSGVCKKESQAGRWKRSPPWCYPAE